MLFKLCQEAGPNKVQSGDHEKGPTFQLKKWFLREMFFFFFFIIIIYFFFLPCGISSSVEIVSHTSVC